MNGMRIVGMLTSIMLLLLGSTLVVSAAPRAQAAGVNAADFEFVEKTITVAAGTEVTWTNTGSAPHNVTDSGGSWNSENFTNGQTYSRTFDTPGTYNYYCSLHGTAAGAGMAGTVIVEAAAEPTATSAPPTATAQATATTAPPAATEAAPAAPASDLTPSVTVADQAAAGRNVTIPEVVAAQAGWLVIHDSDADGNMIAPANIGRTAVTAGTTQNVVVTLERDVAAGHRLYAMLHIDAGVAGTYEFPGADAPATAAGAVVVKPFTITAAAAAPAGMPTTGSDASAIGLTIFAAGLLLAGAALLGRRRIA